MFISNSGLGIWPLMSLPVGAESVFEASIVKGEGLNVDPVADIVAGRKSEAPSMSEIGDWIRKNQETVFLVVGGIALLAMMRR